MPLCMYYIQEVYGLLPVTTRQILCKCTCSSGSRYLRRHASFSDTDVQMIGYAFIATRCDIFGDGTSFFVLMHLFFWIYRYLRQHASFPTRIGYAFIATRCDAFAFSLF